VDPSGISRVNGMPLRPAIMAKAMPVLPLVASTTLRPCSRPCASAASNIDSAARSLTDPPRLLPSSLP